MRPWTAERRSRSGVQPLGRSVRLLFVLATVGSGALLLVSCGPPPAWLEPLFPGATDPANAPKPYVGNARRESPKKTIEQPAPVAPGETERPDVDAIYATLPRNDDGQIMWMKALADKTIAPKPGIAADAKDEEPTDMDVELEPKGQPEYKVVFSHKVHTSWLVCDNCHTSLFEMEKGKSVITMDKINAGEACGVCHGKVAAPEPTACPVCHKAMGK